MSTKLLLCLLLSAGGAHRVQAVAAALLRQRAAASGACEHRRRGQEVRHGTLWSDADVAATSPGRVAVAVASSCCCDEVRRGRHGLQPWAQQVHECSTPQVPGAAQGHGCQRRPTTPPLAPSPSSTTCCSASCAAYRGAAACAEPVGVACIRCDAVHSIQVQLVDGDRAPRVGRRRLRVAAGRRAVHGLHDVRVVVCRHLGRGDHHGGALDAGPCTTRRCCGCCQVLLLLL